MYRSWAATNDEGWTRFVLEQYGFEPKTLDNAAIRAGNLATAFDAIVLPDESRDVIATGRPKREDGDLRSAIEPPPDTRAAWRRKARPRCAISSRRAAR